MTITEEGIDAPTTARTAPNPPNTSQPVPAQKARMLVPGVARAKAYTKPDCSRSTHPRSNNWPCSAPIVGSPPPKVELPIRVYNHDRFFQLARAISRTVAVPMLRTVGQKAQTEVCDTSVRSAGGGPRGRNRAP